VCCGARGSFYRAGGQEGRRCGEGNGRRQKCTFKAFNPSVTGGERRGEWGVKGEGKCGAVSGRGGVIGAAGARGGRWWRRRPVGLLEEEDGQTH
jgi:hypothetical protein